MNNLDDMDIELQGSEEKGNQSDYSWSFGRDSADIEEIEEKIDATSERSDSLSEEEKKQTEASIPKVYSIWERYYHSYDNAAGVFHIHQSLKQEQNKILQDITSKKLTTQRRKPKKINQLFSNSTNYLGQQYQTFIPNTVNL